MLWLNNDNTCCIHVIQQVISWTASYAYCYSNVDNEFNFTFFKFFNLFLEFI